MTIASLKKVSIPPAFDPNGNPVHLNLDDQGRLIVTESDPGTCIQIPDFCVDLTATGQTPDVVTLGEVVIADTADFKGIGWSLSSNVDTIITISRIDDAAGTPVETVIHRFLLTPSNPHSCCKLECKEFDTQTFTGEQRFRVTGEAVDWKCLGPVLGFAYTRQAA